MPKGRVKIGVVVPTARHHLPAYIGGLIVSDSEKKTSLTVRFWLGFEFRYGNDSYGNTGVEAAFAPTGRRGKV
jgi:hypothetical protein